MNQEGAERAGASAAPHAISRRKLAFLGGLTLIATLAGGLRWAARSPTSAPPPSSASGPNGARVISLSPGITATMVALDAGDALVGISDFCAAPAGTAPRRVGTALTPNYEVIAELAPSLIIASEVKGEQLKPLKRLAPSTSLPWLTLDQWTSSITELGALVDRKPQATTLRAEVLSTLDVAPPKSGPRVLFVLDYDDTGSNEVWFIRRNSIHGALLHAAGARNAVARDIVGPPKLSPEELLAIDPDAIIALRGDQTDNARAQVVARFARYKPLSAVKHERIDVLSSADALTVGPAVLGLVPRLRAIVESFGEGDAR